MNKSIEKLSVLIHHIIKRGFRCDCISQRPAAVLQAFSVARARESQSTASLQESFGISPSQHQPCHLRPIVLLNEAREDGEHSRVEVKEHCVPGLHDQARHEIGGERADRA